MAGDMLMPISIKQAPNANAIKRENQGTLGIEKSLTDIPPPIKPIPSKAAPKTRQMVCVSHIFLA
jgi:hypothetical protein